METEPVWHLSNIVVGHCKHVEIGQVERNRHWDLSDLVIANIEHLQLLVLWPAELSDLNKSVLMEMKLLESGQELADGRHLTQLVPVQAEITKVFHVYLGLLNILT